ncbi:MAG: hypothetical protein ACUVUC_05150 [Thermoguttaceae bacterium]
MAESSTTRKPIATPRQLILIAVLGVILAVVLIQQFSGASGSPEPVQQAAPSRTSAGEKAQAAVAQTDSEPVGGQGLGVGKVSGRPSAPQGPAGPPRAPWPRIDAKTAGQYDPFALPEPLARQLAPPAKQASPAAKANPPAARARPSAGLFSLRSKGVHAVIQDQTGAVAVIDNRLVRVGDLLEGYRVISIDRDGVLVAPPDWQDVQKDRK